LPIARQFRIVANVETVALRLSILPKQSGARRRRITVEAAIKPFSEATPRGNCSLENFKIYG
jgi:hypothetical protein